MQCDAYWLLRLGVALVITLSLMAGLIATNLLESRFPGCSGRVGKTLVIQCLSQN